MEDSSQSKRERRMRRKVPVRCGPGEKAEVKIRALPIGINGSEFEFCMTDLYGASAIRSEKTIKDY